MVLEVYGIKTCDTVRRARKWLDARDVTHRYVDLRATPPTREQIAAWVGTVGSKPMRNTSGGAYRALGADKASWDEAQWIEAFADDPMLLKRPLIVRDGTLVKVGFRGDDAALQAEILGQ